MFNQDNTNLEAFKAQAQDERNAKRAERLAAKVAKAAKKFSPKSFLQEWGATYDLAQYAAKILKLVSMVTIGFAVYELGQNALPFDGIAAQVLAGILGLFAAFAVETVRGRLFESLNVKALNQAFDGPFILVAILALSISALSVGASYYGASEALEMTKPEQIAWAESPAKKAFEAERKEALDGLSKDVKDFYAEAKQSWKKKVFIPKDMQGTYKNKQDALDKARLDWDNKEAQAAKEYAEINDTHKSRFDGKQNAVAVFIFVCELLLIGVLVFCGYFEFRAFVESKEAQQFQQNLIPASGPFTLIKNPEKQGPLFAPKACKNCGKQFNPKGPKHSFCSQTCRDNYR